MNQKLLEKRFLEMIEEDQGDLDITTEFTPNKKVRAEIIANEEGIVSGIYELEVLFRLFDIRAKPLVRDGEKIKKEQQVFSLMGDSKDILLVERTALNILSRMSGVSTLSREFINKTKRFNVKVAATRKTTPLFSYFEKRAVKIAGGDMHRFNLSDEVLIKDNHLRMFRDVGKAVKTAKKSTSFTKKVEIEVNNTRDAILAVKNGADIIMLDNMSVENIRETIYKLEEEGLREKVIIEVSGRINLDNVVRYAETGVDVISIGQITHSAPALDFSLRIL